jgi:penicillin amidase
MVLHLIHRTDSVSKAMFGSSMPVLPDSYNFSVPNITFIPGMEVQVSGIGGSDNTINVNYGAHPVIRTVIECKIDTISSWMVNAIGQTGRINESAYFGQLNMWKKNELHKTQFVRERKMLKNITQVIVFNGK